ncbi:MAG: alkaline phosphatase family protein [Planctomycetota bacterium]|jgi:predicted AlkP superfamily pyrophosphatase or phosphodiesterase
MKLLVVDVVGLRPRDLAGAPRISELARQGFMAPMTTVFPALTCSVQATWLTGKHPSEHGIVANGWYFRDLAQVMFWRQANQLIQGEKIYEAAARQDPSFTCAKMFWWFNMYAPVDWSLTPRPEYWADGLKKPGLYSEPPELASGLQERLGAFPLFQFWGPGAGIASSRWIVDASLAVMKEQDPSLALVYIPHLDYDHQRYGPDDQRSQAAVGEVDLEVGRLIDHARSVGAEVMILSEYGIEAVTRPVFINRVLHERGLLRVQETSHGQLLDAGASKAFAVADHQIAHLYLGSGASISEVKALVSGLEGVARVLDREEQASLKVDHPRSGDLLCIAEPGCWFAYHYWLDESRRPDFASTVDIHRKPGYDPTELFLDPELRFPKLRIAKNLLKKKLGFRYLMDVIGTDPGLVRGSHGRLFEEPDAGPLFISSAKTGEAANVQASEVSARILSVLAP